MSLDEDEKEKIQALVMLEIMGKPPEHLTETLDKLIKQMDEEEGISVRKKEIKEPVPLKDKIKFVKKNSEEKATEHDFYTTFAEIEVELDDIFNLILIMFKYMPAHIEIVSPELLALTNNGWNEVVNEFMRRLHNYDEVARVLQIEKEVLQRQLKKILEEKKEENPKKKEED